MNNQKTVDKEILLWETKFFAISAVTGEFDLFKGMFIEATNLQEAFKVARDLKLDYLQFTGRWFRDWDAVHMEEEFYKIVRSPREGTIGMDYDEFNNWLDLAHNEYDLNKAIESFTNEGLHEYVQLIEAYKNNKYGKKEDEEEDDEGTENSPV